MMKPSEKINRTWQLKQFGAEVLLDSGLAQTKVTVNLELSPQPQLVLHCEFAATDAWATNEIGIQREVDVRLDTGIVIRVSVGNRWTLGGGKISNILIPDSGPVTVLEESVELSRCKFVLVNFPAMMGKQDVKRYPEPGKTSHWVTYPRFKLIGNPWLIDILAEGSAGGMHHRLTRYGGSAITHIGTITRLDGQVFSVSELQDLLSALHLFLSFVRGSYCGLALLSGHDLNRRRVWEQWGSYGVEPWKRELGTWAHPFRSHLLSSIFSGFWRSFKDQAISDTVSQVIHWYLRSNESSEPEVSIVLTQAALERLAYNTVGPRSGKYEGAWIAEALDKKGIDTGIPSSCSELCRISPNENWSHGPHALVDIRNNLVHAARRAGESTATRFLKLRN